MLEMLEMVICTNCASVAMWPVGVPRTCRTCRTTMSLDDRAAAAFEDIQELGAARMLGDMSEEDLRGE